MERIKSANLMARLYGDQINGTTEFYRLIKERLSINDCVLDLGCGFGKQATDLRDGSRFVVGCDLGEDIRRNQFLCSGIQGSAYELPFKESVFDVVVMDYVLEHLQFPEKCAREIVRVLRPEGKFFFRTPNLFHYAVIVARFTPHRFHQFIVQWLDESHETETYGTFYHANTRRAVRRTFESVGLKAEKLMMVEKEPRYLAFSRPTLLAGYCYERIVNSSDAFATLRSNIFGIMIKSDSSNGQPH